MADKSAPSSAESNLTAIGPFLYWLAVGLVMIGLMNSIPGIPGFDQAVRDISGHDWFKLRKFTREWFFPMVLALMMLIVALKHSMYRSWRDRSALWRRFGLLMDVALVTAAFGISLTYIIEIEAICLVDQFTGERARLIERSLTDAAETAALYGLPAPTTVEDPQCVGTTGGWLVLIIVWFVRI